MDVEKTIRQYLPQVVHMSLATCKNNKPWVCEVHFAYDEDLNIYFRSLPSRRHSLEIAENPYVAGNIVTQHHLDQQVRGVYFEGTARKLEAGDEQKQACETWSKRLCKDAAPVLEEIKNPESGQFYKISVEKFYLFDTYKSSPGQKYELQWDKR